MISSCENASFSQYTGYSYCATISVWPDLSERVGTLQTVSPWPDGDYPQFLLLIINISSLALSCLSSSASRICVLEHQTSLSCLGRLHPKLRLLQYTFIIQSLVRLVSFCWIIFLTTTCDAFHIYSVWFCTSSLCQKCSTSSSCSILTKHKFCSVLCWWLVITWRAESNETA